MDETCRHFSITYKSSSGYYIIVHNGHDLPECLSVVSYLINECDERYLLHDGVMKKTPAVIPNCSSLTYHKSTLVTGIHH